MRSGLGGRYYLRPAQGILRLCGSPHGCLHTYDQRVASQSPLDPTADLETLRAGITPQRPGDSPFRSGGAVSFKYLSLDAHQAWTWRFRSPVGGVLGRMGMLKDSSAPSRKKKSTSMSMKTSPRRETASGILSNTSIIRNVHIRHWGI